MILVRCAKPHDRPHVFPLYAELGQVLGRPDLGVEWMRIQPWTLTNYGMLVYLVDGVHHGFVDWLRHEKQTVQVLNLYVNPAVKTHHNRLMTMTLQYWKAYRIRTLTALTLQGHEQQWVRQGFTPEYQVFLQKELR